MGLADARRRYAVRMASSPSETVHVDAWLAAIGVAVESLDSAVAAGGRVLYDGRLCFCVSDELAAGLVDATGHAVIHVANASVLAAAGVGVALLAVNDLAAFDLDNDYFAANVHFLFSFVAAHVAGEVAESTVGAAAILAAKKSYDLLTDTINCESYCSYLEIE